MTKADKITAINEVMATLYRDEAVSERLSQSVLYSIEAGGKRVRPLLFLYVLQAFGLSLTNSHFLVAAAIEMIHTGSLIHDDLPAMDDDNYRRGNLTNHKAFDEATAILAGDSLFLDSFGLLASVDLPADIRLSLIRELSEASGSRGMVTGQMLDMQAEGKRLSLQEVEHIHANKTGALLTFPFLAAGIVAQVSGEVMAKLKHLGQTVGLAFQIRDDILDVTVAFDDLGKTPKKDLQAEKSTYPSLLGLEESYVCLDNHLNKARGIVAAIDSVQDFKAEQLLDLIESLRLHG